MGCKLILDPWRIFSMGGEIAKDTFDLMVSDVVNTLDMVEIADVHEVGNELDNCVAELEHVVDNEDVMMG